MAFDGTGKVYIPNDEFWIFVTGLIPLDDPFSLRNPRVDGEVIKIDIVNENVPDEVIEVKEIDLAEFWAFVDDYHPFAKSGAKFCFGVPNFADFDVEIEYAASTVCHPLEWAEPPKFMARWNEV